MDKFQGRYQVPSALGSLGLWQQRGLFCHDITFAWQARYHDRVIRDADQHARIQHYIAINPQRWAEDSLYC